MLVALKKHEHMRTADKFCDQVFGIPAECLDLVNECLDRLIDILHEHLPAFVPMKEIHIFCRSPSWEYRMCHPSDTHQSIVKHDDDTRTDTAGSDHELLVRSEQFSDMDIDLLTHGSD
jgi:hypothetical protein